MPIAMLMLSGSPPSVSNEMAPFCPVSCLSTLKKNCGPYFLCHTMMKPYSFLSPLFNCKLLEGQSQVLLICLGLYVFNSHDLAHLGY